MTYLIGFFIVGAVLLLGAMSPGPDFVVVAKNATLGSRRAGIFTALGVALAVIIPATYSLLGLGIVIEHSIVAFSIIKWLGALYLAYLGVSLMGAKKSTVPEVSEAMNLQHRSVSARKAFLEGFGTNVLNPKAALFFVGIFAQVISPDASFLLKMAYVL